MGNTSKAITGEGISLLNKFISINISNLRMKPKKRSKRGKKRKNKRSKRRLKQISNKKLQNRSMTLNKKNQRLIRCL